MPPMIPAIKVPATKIVSIQYSIANALDRHFGSRIMGSGDPANIDPTALHIRLALSRTKYRRI